QQLSTTPTLAEIRAHHQRVDEETNQRFDLRPLAVGDWRPDDDVSLSGVTAEQSLPACEHGHEKSHAFTLTKLLQGCGECGRELNWQTCAGLSVYCRTRSVSWQLE